MPATNECEHRITTLTDNRSQEHVPKPQLHAGNQLSAIHCASQIYTGFVQIGLDNARSASVSAEHSFSAKRRIKTQESSSGIHVRNANRSGL